MFKTNIIFYSLEELMDAPLHRIKKKGRILVGKPHPLKIKYGIPLLADMDNQNDRVHQAKVSISHLIDFTLTETEYALIDIDHIPDIIKVLEEYLDYQEENYDLNNGEVKLIRDGCIKLHNQYSKFVEDNIHRDKRLQKSSNYTLLDKKLKQYKY